MGFNLEPSNSNCNTWTQQVILPKWWLSSYAIHNFLYNWRLTCSKGYKYFVSCFLIKRHFLLKKRPRVYLLNEGEMVVFQFTDMSYLWACDWKVICMLFRHICHFLSSRFDHWHMSRACVCLILLAYAWFWTYVCWHVRSFLPY